MSRLTVAVCMLGLMAAGCSGDDPPTDRATTTTTAAVGDALDSQRCGPVAFTPDSEDAASEITATGLDCTEAEAFVRVAGLQVDSAGPEQVEVDGYTCLRTRVETDPIPVARYACSDGERKVTFART